MHKPFMKMRKSSDPGESSGLNPRMWPPFEMGSIHAEAEQKLSRRQISPHREEMEPFLSHGDTKQVKPKFRSVLMTKLFLLWKTVKRVVYGVEPSFESRSMDMRGNTTPHRSEFVKNVVRNQKYNAFTFLPVVLYEQFRFFFNLYFLMVAMTQFIPPLKIGFLFTYIAPLAFVLTITILKEAYDDLKRHLRDREANSQKFQKLTVSGIVMIPSSEICVGDLILVGTNQRVPSDGLLLRTTEKSGASFIRTDQLDGETDWKLRYAVPWCQELPSDRALFDCDFAVFSESPRKEIYEFVGTIRKSDPNDADEEIVEGLSLENTIWSNCVVASGTCILLILYTGRETRSVMNASLPKSKVGMLERELNVLSKLLFLCMLCLALIIVGLKGFYGYWYIYLFRFILLFSSIIPISLRVNLDMGKTMYSIFMMRDKAIEGTVVRNSGIPEELGRISYLLSDKTGTLTQNDMVFKRLHLGFASFRRERLDEIKECLSTAYEFSSRTGKGIVAMDRDYKKCFAVKEAISALALCHNVTPVVDDDGNKDYQASSPDEIALVKFAGEVGLSLEERSRHSVVVQNPHGVFEEFEILHMFPFSSERKRMGIVIRNVSTKEISFLLKGADVIMQKFVQQNDWLAEECDNLARDGLRTLVVAKREVDEEEYRQWHRTKHILQRERKSSTEMQQWSRPLDYLLDFEKGMAVLALTGVEDRLQDNVPESLETLRNGGIRTWMLTGDKVDTAICVARASRLVDRTQPIHVMESLDDLQEVCRRLREIKDTGNSSLVVDGSTLMLCLDQCKEEFLNTAKEATSVVICRCSPTQKAQVVMLLRTQSNSSRRVCAIGDGGNDVSMIQAADVGLGIVGKEGKQASLAADFSLLQFSYITRLLLWHGRNSYKRSARLSQFVIHRGLIITVIQAVFSAIFYFAAIPIYTNWLMVGYATYYTMLPVFSLVLDTDVDVELAMMYPELYHELQKGRSLSYKTFLTWVLKAVYQGGAIMLLAIILFEDSLMKIVSISFTALILTELLMVAFEVHKLTKFMIYAEFASCIVYFISMLLLPTYFDFVFIMSLAFWWRVMVIVAFSVIPVYLGKIIHRRMYPSAYQKLVPG